MAHEKKRKKETLRACAASKKKFCAKHLPNGAGAYATQQIIINFVNDFANPRVKLFRVDVTHALHHIYGQFCGLRSFLIYINFSYNTLKLK